MLIFISFFIEEEYIMPTFRVFNSPEEYYMDKFLEDSTKIGAELGFAAFFCCLAALRKQEIAKARATAEKWAHENVKHPNSDARIYVHPDYLTLTWKNSNGTQWNVVVRYDGPTNIGDRIIIDEEINGPRWEKSVSEAMSAYSPIGFCDYLQQRGCYCSDIGWGLLCGVCCGVCGPPIQFFECYMGYKQGYEKLCVSQLANIKLKQFWKEQEEDAFRRADTSVSRRIEESKSMLQAFHTLQQSSGTSTAQSSGSKSDNSYGNSQQRTYFPTTIPPRPANMI